MPLTAIPGVYRVVGASPDGDSIRFYPASAGAFTDAGLRVRTNSAGGAQLRLDAIDALETHYTPPGATYPWHQPGALGDGASAALLNLLGFTDVRRDDHGYVTDASPVEQPGYILTRFGDKYGRAVAFAFPGKRVGGTSRPVYLDVTEMRNSVNYRLLTAGWAYPTFYSKLYVDLREDLAQAANSARADGAGIWKDDQTNSGFTVVSRDQLQRQLVILPKLFRRLAEYLMLEPPNSVAMSGFHRFLEAKNDRLFTVPAGQATALDTLVEIHRRTITLTLPPEQMIFSEA